MKTTLIKILLKYLLPPTLTLFVGVIGYQYYTINKMTNKQDKIVRDNNNLTNKVTQQSKAIETINESFNEYRDNSRRTNEAFSEFQSELINLEQQLSEHNLTRLIDARPESMQRVINNGTKEVLNEIRDITNWSNNDDRLLNNPNTPTDD